MKLLIDYCNDNCTKFDRADAILNYPEMLKTKTQTVAKVFEFLKVSKNCENVVIRTYNDYVLNFIGEMISRQKISHRDVRIYYFNEDTKTDEIYHYNEFGHLVYNDDKTGILKNTVYLFYIEDHDF